MPVVYLGVFGQQVGVAAVDGAQLLHHQVLSLLADGALGVDPVAQVPGQHLQGLSAQGQVGYTLQDHSALLSPAFTKSSIHFRYVFI
jgi:hypothetical protein